MCQSGSRGQVWGGTHRKAGGPRRPSLSFQALERVISELSTTSLLPAPLTPNHSLPPTRVTHPLSRLPLLALGKDMSNEGQRGQPRVWPSPTLSTLDIYLWTMHRARFWLWLWI